MIRWETLSLALSGLRAHRPRSALEMLGLIVGAAVISVLRACGPGLVNSVDAVIVSILLLVGGIGVGHIMLVSVTDRIREIGLYKAIGASDSTIVGQFVLEAAALAGLGGLLGVGLGFGLILLARALGSLLAAFGDAPAPLSLVVSLPPVVAVFVICIAIGAIAGGYPAYRAAHIDTVDALRHMDSLDRVNPVSRDHTERSWPPRALFPW